VMFEIDTRGEIVMERAAAADRIADAEGATISAGTARRADSIGCKRHGEVETVKRRGKINDLGTAGFKTEAGARTGDCGRHVSGGNTVVYRAAGVAEGLVRTVEAKVGCHIARIADAKRHIGRICVAKTDLAEFSAHIHVSAVDAGRHV